MNTGRTKYKMMNVTLKKNRRTYEESDDENYENDRMKEYKVTEVEKGNEKERKEQ